MTPTTRRLASGSLAQVDARGRVTAIWTEDDMAWEGPSCSLCDALGHGYPGGPPCPLEDRGEYDPCERELWALEDAAAERDRVRREALDAEDPGNAAEAAMIAAEMAAL